MKIVPVLAITNALALALAIYVYVEQGSNRGGSVRSDVVRTDPIENARLEMRLNELERLLAAKARESAAPDALAHGTTEDPAGAPAGSDGASPLASQPPEMGADPAGAVEEEFNPREMETFRKKVKKAQELNEAEDQKTRIVEGIDRLVKENKIGSLTPAQKESVANTVVVSRKKGIDIWRKLREGGGIDSTNREEMGRIVRQEMETVRTETQRALEEIMPAIDAKTYLDETMRDAMRGWGGFGGAAPPTPAVPARGR
ncbi:MAG: hypothetical protein ACHQ1G_04370 [Planctomycetota bacterium]